MSQHINSKNIFCQIHCVCRTCNKIQASYPEDSRGRVNMVCAIKKRHAGPQVGKQATVRQPHRCHGSLLSLRVNLPPSAS